MGYFVDKSMRVQGSEVVLFITITEKGKFRQNITERSPCDSDIGTRVQLK